MLAQYRPAPVRLAGIVWRAIIHLGTIDAALSLCWELIEQGGVRVQTPPAPATPAIMTTVQLDGDVMTLVDSALLQGQSDTRMSLGQQHAAAVRDALAPLSLLPDALQAVYALPFAFITVANCGFFASTAWSPNRLSDIALTELGGSVAVQAILIVLWRSIRRILFRTLSVALRWRVRWRLADWRAESRKSLAELQARSAARRAAHAG